MSKKPPISASGQEGPSPVSRESSDRERLQSDATTSVARPAHERDVSNSLASFDARIAQMLPWLHEASNPYWDWLWGSPTEALAQLKERLSRPNSELSEKRVVCLSEGGRVVGGYIALAGHELQVCRKADLLELVKYLRRNPHEGVMTRMRQSGFLFGSVAEDEFYLSRVGVIPSVRGRGIGKQLVEMFLENGCGRGFKQFRLDVSADNERAIRLYCTAGFVVANESAIPETPIRYFSMIMPLRRRTET